MSGRFPREEYLWYNKRKEIGEAYLTRAADYSATILSLVANYTRGDLHATIATMRHTLIAADVQPPDVHMASWWFDNMTQYINTLKRFEGALGRQIVAQLHERLSTLRDDIILSATTVVCTVAICPVIALSVYRMTKSLQIYAASLQKRTEELNKEQKLTDKLLYQMLPKSVADHLKQGRSASPEHYDCVTIYFSDIVDFTRICSRSTPFQVVDMLNTIYNAFDDKVDLFDVYKVETIGDAYMVASGLPIPNGDGHFQEIADLALELLEAIKQVRIAHLEELLKIRIGIHSDYTST
ncbi:PREDICTED: receptor-type guanylate cyclase gcy-22-like [Priapulus caudatus]|uniref:guanylate cyclase n=1 Tax=Priapulus caudatus TaxID=37621 RepID=A0ABM1EDI6_PRICU|nr:PREDICTED: receptor-type guanylate cyclase gcy-22-like [Priapulus caudatus]